MSCVVESGPQLGKNHTTDDLAADGYRRVVVR